LTRVADGGNHTRCCSGVRSGQDRAIRKVRQIDYVNSEALAWIARRLLLATVLVALAAPAAQSAPNRCNQLKALAAKVRSDNELIQEEHLRNLDPHWCQHARSVIGAMSETIEIIKSNSSHCNVSNDKIEALDKSNYRMSQLAEGRP
jgi:hypothetical protein